MTKIDVGEAVETASLAADAGATHIIFYYRPPFSASAIDELAEAASALV